MTDTPANIALITGNVFDTELPAIAHGVNVDGIMGAGFARLIRSKYPEVHAAYWQVCADKRLHPGQMLPLQGEDGIWILNAASQDRPGRNARLEWVEQSLTQAFRFSEFKKLEGFAMVRIGAKIGGLVWADVFEITKRVASDFPNIRLEIWTLPQDLAEETAGENA
jgi:O-acetyl-ADP-ribose deacetylase (regulator of RNase III)